MARRKLRNPPLEEPERLYIKALYEAAGCTVINFSQAQRAQQTKGIPDLLIYDERSGTSWWHEVKRQQGPEFYALKHGQTPDQKWFQDLVEGFGQEYLLGARDVAEAKLRELGRLAH